MKKGIITEIDWKYIGAILANESDEDQAMFFKSFVQEAKKYGTSYQTYYQMASIGSKLTEEEKELISHISYIPED